MKKVILIIVGILALGLILCAGLVFAVTATPLRGKVQQALEQVFDRNRPNVRVESNQAGQQGEEAGVLVARVVSGSPADEAGVKRGDILLEVDGQPVNSIADLRAVLQVHQPGDEVELVVQRGDAKQTLSAALTEGTGGGAYLGIQPGQAVAEDRQGPPMQFQMVTGAKITEVVADSPAEKAGLKVGDTILSVDGQTFTGDQDLAAIITNHQPGDSVTLQVKDESGDTRDVKVQLGENPDKAGASWLGIRYELAFAGPMDGAMPGKPSLPGDQEQGPAHPNIPFPNGIQASGALVQEVVNGSPAENAGLKAGQIVQAVDGKTLENVEDLSSAIAAHQPGDQVTLQVLDSQTGKTSDLQVTLGENPDKAGTAWLGIQYTFIKMDTEPGQLPEG